MGVDETGRLTGTKDKDYNIIWFTEQCLSNVLRMEEYAQDAERDGDAELADFFRRAQAASHRGGEQGKAMLARRLSGSPGAVGEPGGLPAEAPGEPGGITPGVAGEPGGITPGTPGQPGL